MRLMTHGLFYSMVVLTGTTGVVYANELSLQHIRPYQAEYDYFEMADEQVLHRVGSWTDEVSISNDVLIRTVQRASATGQVEMSRTVAARQADMQPVFVQQRFGLGLEQVLYAEMADQRLTQMYLPALNTAARRIITDLKQRPVEVNLQGLFAAALPFQSKATEFKAIGYTLGAAPQAKHMTFEFHGPESLELAGQSITAWKVTEPDSHWTYWVRPEFPYLVQVSHPSPNGTVWLSKLRTYSISGDAPESSQ